MIQWLTNPNFFVDNAPPRVIGVEPSQRIWTGTIFDSSNAIAIQLGLSRCRQLHPLDSCGVSNTLPQPCTQSGVLLGPDGAVVGGSQGIDVCQYSMHIYAYTVQVTLGPDFSVYDPEAPETADILKRLRNNCGGAINPTDAQRSDSILGGLLGAAGIQIWGVPNTDNSFVHAPFPGDSLFNYGDATFHHYDVKTSVCTNGQSGCDPTTIQALLRYYSYPARELDATYTQVNGTEHVLAFISPPYLTGSSLFYRIPAGNITQSFVTSPPWAGAIQNVTESNHVVYPGTISRYVQQTPTGIQIFTHRMGHNRAFCSTAAPYRLVQVLMSYSNDVFGYRAFKQLDKEMVWAYQSNYLPPGAAQQQDPCEDRKQCVFVPPPSMMQFQHLYFASTSGSKFLLVSSQDRSTSSESMIAR